MEAKFKKGDKVIYINDEEIDDYRIGSVYTVKSMVYSPAHCDWCIETEEVDVAGRWQWKFELSKSHIVSSILRDL